MSPGYPSFVSTAHRHTCQGCLRFAQDRIEISSPGPLYGAVTPGNFPAQTSYRNPVLAEAMKTLGAVNRFGRGVERARAAMARNGNPPPEFEFGDTYLKVTMRILS
ncbi:MAG: hypothetical protein FJW39_08365 [Acidobacteria bacterium]|nr:hypothetical protein [Acidobacteriota bacterium]